MSAEHAGMAFDATVPERMIQVPESLIASAWALVSDQPENPTVKALDALLSQPTPTAEPLVSICDCGHAFGEHFGATGQCAMVDCACKKHVHKEFYGQPAAPPSIADMGSGTTFTAESPDGSGRALFRVLLVTAWDDRREVGYPFRAFDRYTIRDVQPPARREED